MTERGAKEIEAACQVAGYRVRAQPSPLGRWELVCDDSRGGRARYALTVGDVRLLILGGVVSKS